MTTARAFHTSVLLADDRVVVAGGTSGGHEPRAVEQLVPDTGDVLVLADALPRGRHAHASVALPDARVLLAGGYVDDLPSASVEVLELASGTVVELDALHTARVGHTATHLGEDRVLIIGGRNTSTGALASVELVEPGRAPLELAPLMHARSGHTATALDDDGGSVVVVGGVDAQGEPIADVEQYHVERDAWQPLAPLPVAREGHATVRVGTRIVVIGGEVASDDSGPRWSSRVDVLDLTTGRWAQAGELQVGRAHHSAVVLSDGRIMVAGGRGAGGVLASVELLTL